MPESPVRGLGRLLEYPNFDALCKKLRQNVHRRSFTIHPQVRIGNLNAPQVHFLLGAVVSGCFRRAQRLDATYPDLPCLIPAETAALHYASTDAHAAPLTLPVTHLILGGGRLKSVVLTRDVNVPTQDVREAMYTVDGWIGKAPDTKFSIQDDSCYADITVITVNVRGYLCWAGPVWRKEQPGARRTKNTTAI
ncbi:hypothetical protein B0H15DRAFT_867056 [Mycena belliarum]|uniref:Uncharacterized protein n=1 Tax=Mycena belliarum TaxID=1033014 RepID=A0AAD6TR13_9AGAR|nr:hypothetical protein B0H15DRAFT_867056 [Mycena belliae]